MASSDATGSVFRGTNRNGLRRWTTTCTVTDASPGARFAFDVTYGPVPIARWVYDLTAVDGGCRVVESTVDRRPRAFVPIGGFATGTRDRGPRNFANIRATLERLKDRAEAG